MNKKFITLLPLIFLIAGCSSSNHGDLEEWMVQQTKQQKGMITPLPEAKRFVPIEFIAEVDPFNERPILMREKTPENKYAPDPYRRKETLEQYPLSELILIGILELGNKKQGLVRTPDNIVHQVSIGNYMGSNYGKIIEIKETELVLDERVRGGSDGWSSINTIVPLVEESEQPNRR